MKNIQVIDGAENCVYDIFAASDEDFALLFPSGEDVAFIDEVCSRADPARLQEVFSRLWQHRVRKCDAVGIHGLLFYELGHKAAYYPTRRDEEARNPDGSLLRSRPA